MAPEVRSGNFYGFPGDIYSLGLVLYEIFEGRLPDFDQYRQVIVMPQIYKFYSVIHPCVRIDPMRRPSAADLVNELNMAIHIVMTAVYEVLPDEEKKNIAVEDTMEKTLVNLYRYLVLKEDQTSCETLINNAIQHTQTLQDQFNIKNDDNSQQNNQQQGYNQQYYQNQNPYGQQQQQYNPYYNPNPYPNMNYQQYYQNPYDNQRKNK